MQNTTEGLNTCRETQFESDTFVKKEWIYFNIEYAFNCMWLP